MTDSAADARKYSLKVLGYRDRSESELCEKLRRKGFSEKIITDTIEFLRRSGYLDDKKVALNLKKQAISDRLMGFNGAKMFMLKRGIPPEIIESTLHYDEDEELRTIHRLIEKKLKTLNSLSDEKNRKKMWNFLARRGYSFNTIRKALKEYLNLNVQEDQR